MNKIYKVQYNDALGTWVAVPEIAKGRSKSTSSAEHAESTASLSKPGKWALTTLAAALLPMVSGQAFADTAPPDVQTKYDYTTKMGANAQGACYGEIGTGRIACGDATVQSYSENSTAFGIGVNVKGKNSLAIGTNSTIDADNAIVLGSVAKAKYAGSVVLGANSTDSEQKGIAATAADYNNIKYSTLNFEAKDAKGGTFSVGSDGGERRVVNLAAGNVTEGSTDAINGSQLNATNKVIGNLAKTVADNLGGGATVNDNGSIKEPTYNVTDGTGDKSVNSVGDALTNLNKAVKQKITFAGDTGSKEVGLGDGLKIVGDGKNISTEVTGDRLKVTMTSTPTFDSVTINNDPTNENDATTKKYVDDGRTTVTSKDSSIKVKVEPKPNGKGGTNYDVSIDNQAVVENARVPVVYTTTEGGKEVKVTYNKEEDKFYSTATKKEVDKDKVHASMNNANGDVNTPMTLGNLGKGTQDGDAGNVAQLNDILKKLGNPDDQSASVPKIGANGSVEGLEYYLTSGDPSKDNKAANAAEAYKKLYDEQYAKLKKENDALPKDKQKPDEKLKKDAAKFAMTTAESKGYGKVVNSVGAAISNLNTAVNQAITVNAENGGKGVYLGGEFSIVGGASKVKTWDDAAKDYAKDKSGKYVTTDAKNITTSIEGSKVIVSMTDTPQFTTADVQHVDPSKGTSAINVDFLKDSVTTVDSSDGTISVKNNKTTGEIANKYDIKVNSQKVVENAQLPVVYTDKEGNKVYLTTDPTTNAPKFSKKPDGTEPVDTAEVVATMQTPKGTTEIAKGDEGTAKTEIVTKDAKKPNGARDIKLASPVSSDPITISVDDDGNYNRVQLSSDAQEKTTALNNIASVGDYTKVENAAKAVNGADLNNAIAGVLSYVDQTKATGEGGWNLMGNNQNTVEEVIPKGTVQIKGDGNITVGVQKSGDIVEANVELNSKLKNMEKIEFVPGDDGKSSSVSISKNGIKAGEKKITNVADGAINASSHDAVNGSQLYRLKQDIDNIDNRASAGTAAAMATAGLSQVYLPGKSMVSAAASHYRGQSAIAVGLSTISDNGKWIIKGAANANKEDLGVTVGVGYMW